jgi:AcrR family transcriptional regulator
MKDSKKAKLLTVARSVFLRYGYRRVSMSDIAEAAGISRAALYLVFKNKEAIFAGVFLQWVDETLVEIHGAMASATSPERKLQSAFEVWAVRPFEMVKTSPEAKDLIECSFEFAQPSLRKGYKQFEAAIAPVLASFSEDRPASAHLAPERIAHVLASAVRGFKQTATTAAELRELIKELLMACFGAPSSAKAVPRPALPTSVRAKSSRPRAPA